MQFFDRFFTGIVGNENNDKQREFAKIKKK